MPLGNRAFAASLPKVELHVHLEGTVSPGLALRIARRNGVRLPYRTAEEMVAAQDYGFPALQNFLAYHYAVFAAVRTPQDVFEIAAAYLERCAAERVRRTEVHFCLQDYLDQGIPLDGLMESLAAARAQAAGLGVDAAWIYGANRGLPPQDAVDRLESLDERHPGAVVGVGTCSEETGHPPLLFGEFFAQARRRGYRLTAHCDCDQENSIEHIRQCVQDVRVERIDHGVDILQSAELVKEAADRGIHFTVCPTWRPSDPAPRRIPESLAMAARGLSVSYNTDDPEEFASGHPTELLTGILDSGLATRDDVVSAQHRAIDGSWADQDAKRALRAELDSVSETAGSAV
jgi:adenosine deaminase